MVKTRPQESFALVCTAAAGILCASCSQHSEAAKTGASTGVLTVGVVPAEIHPLSQYLTLSSELVPFQEIDVYAKEAGYVKTLLVDYGSRVRKGQLMAQLEIPELEAQLEQDRAAISAQNEEVIRASHEINRVQAQQRVFHLQYERLAGVANSKPGLVAQQEVDDAQGKDLASA